MYILNDIESLTSCIGKLVVNYECERLTYGYQYRSLVMDKKRINVWAACKYDLRHATLLSVTKVDELLTVAKFSVADGIGFNGRTALLLFDQS